ncbi:armadillo-type protein [Ochromonadaceae sp. CCMP2298]|nr:armadillo-type protein [Ochromonadaceae sp. CCMP2298]
MDFVRALTADLSLEDFTKAGGSVVASQLPDFKQARAYLVHKTNQHRWEVDGAEGEIGVLRDRLESHLAKKIDASHEGLRLRRQELKKAHDTAEGLKGMLLAARRAATAASTEKPKPLAPIMEELGPTPQVPKLPTSGNMGARGRKKKALLKEEVAGLVREVEGGALDGVEAWPIDERFPSQAQLLSLGKAAKKRNQVLAQQREGVVEGRDRLMEGHGKALVLWEKDEATREVRLVQCRSALRVENLHFDTAMRVQEGAQAALDHMQRDTDVARDLQSMDRKAHKRYRLTRFKQTLELERQQAYLGNLQVRLMKAVRARVYALSLPATAKTDLQYASLCGVAETALGRLRVEVLEVKVTLTAEGARLRTLYQEEMECVRGEVARLRVSREILQQRHCLDQILERFNTEVGGLQEAVGAAQVAEAEGDVGTETVDDLGERYRPDKKWGNEVKQAKRVLDLCLNKLQLTDGLGHSAGQSQKLLLDVVSAKYGGSALSLRDGWTEAADFERAQGLLEDALQWTRGERGKIEALRRECEADKKDLELRVGVMEEQRRTEVATHEVETVTLTQYSKQVTEVLRDHLGEVKRDAAAKVVALDQSVINLSRECQGIREKMLQQAFDAEGRTKILFSFIYALQTTIQQLGAKMEIQDEEVQRTVLRVHLKYDQTKKALNSERKHTSSLLFIIQSQRGSVRFCMDVIKKMSSERVALVAEGQREKITLRRQIWEQVFAFTRLSTDVDALFDFFAARLANLAGARANLNNQLASNGGAMVLAALCKSPRPSIRKLAARALGGMGWDGFVETRILLWDSVMYWKVFQARVIAKEQTEFQAGLQRFDSSGQLEAIITLSGGADEFVPTGNMSLRTTIKQRRQWALRTARRREGPNAANQQQLNIRDGVIPALLQIALKDGKVDWEISRNAALAISIASYEPHNQLEMTQYPPCVSMIIDMCRGGDPEVQTHAAVTIANLCHNHEASQATFGNAGAVEVLLDLCLSAIVDVLEAATSALANLTCLSDHNCTRVLEYGGVDIMVSVVTSAHSENLLDLDQNDEVQANASEMLANVSRFSIDTTVGLFRGRVIDALVIMCASSNKQLRRHVPLVLGNISQEESCRQEIGAKGGIEALFLVLEDVDTSTQANTLWALSNLMWHPPNQERAGRFMTDLLAFASSERLPCKTQAVTLIANTLYYNGANRVRFLESEGAFELFLHMADSRPDVLVVEGALRALLSLSYVDAIAMWLGENRYIPMFIEYLADPLYSRDSMRYSLEILCNLCLHHSNRRIIYENHGIDAIVALHIDIDPHVRDLSVTIIDYLQDITPAEVMGRIKKDVGLERMVSMASNADPLIRAVAAESIGAEVWADPAKQARAMEIGGVDALLGIAANPLEPTESLLPALWSLRNLLHAQPAAQTQFAYREGIHIVTAVIRQGFRGQYGRQAEQLFEAALSVLHTASVGDERITRKLLMVALPCVLDLAEGRLTQGAAAASHALTAAAAALGPGQEGDEGGGQGDQGGMADQGGTSMGTGVSGSRGGTESVDGTRASYGEVLRGMRGEGVGALAKALLLQLAPYNYIVCRNCAKRQDIGSSCVSCGHRLEVDVDVDQAEMRRALQRAPPDASKKSLVAQAQASYTNSATNNSGTGGAGVGAGGYGTPEPKRGGQSGTFGAFTPPSRQSQGGFSPFSPAPSPSPALNAFSPAPRRAMGGGQCALPPPLSLHHSRSQGPVSAPARGGPGGVAGLRLLSSERKAGKEQRERDRERERGSLLSQSVGKPLPAPLYSSSSNKRLHSPRPLSSEEGVGSGWGLGVGMGAGMGVGEGSEPLTLSIPTPAKFHGQAPLGYGYGGAGSVSSGSGGSLESVGVGVGGAGRGWGGSERGRDGGGGADLSGQAFVSKSTAALDRALSHAGDADEEKGGK